MLERNNSEWEKILWRSNSQREPKNPNQLSSLIPPELEKFVCAACLSQLHMH